MFPYVNYVSLIKVQILCPLISIIPRILFSGDSNHLFTSKESTTEVAA